MRKVIKKGVAGVLVVALTLGGILPVYADEPDSVQNQTEEKVETEEPAQPTEVVPDVGNIGEDNIETPAEEEAGQQEQKKQEERSETVSTAEQETVAEGTVSIPDKNLKMWLVNSSYNTNGDGEISKSEMEGITDFAYGYSGEVGKISDLTGLEYAVNMKSLNIANSNIQDISALRSMTKLKYLGLAENQIADISPLQYNTELQTLYLADNLITDISVLKKLAQLISVNLTDNQISDLSVFNNWESAQLSSVDLSNNQLTDIAPLFFLSDNMPSLNLCGNDAVTKEKLFSVMIADGEEKTVLLGDKLDVNIDWLYSIDIGERNMIGQEAQGDLEKEDIIWNSKTPNIAEVTKDYLIMGKAKGVAELTAKVGNATKSFMVHVVDHATPVSSSAKETKGVEPLAGDASALLDNDNTLWSINSEKTEKVQTKVKNYIGTLVYGKSKKISWGEYFVLDKDNTLWSSNKKDVDASYTSQKLFENVASYGYEYALTKDGAFFDIESKEKLFIDVSSYDGYCVTKKNGDLYSIRTKEKLGNNIKKYNITYQYDRTSFKQVLDDVVLTSDNKVYNIKTKETYAEDVKDLEYYDRGGGKCYFYLDSKGVHVLKTQEQAGKIEEVLFVPDVKSMHNSIFAHSVPIILVKNDGSTWTMSLETFQISKITDNTIVEDTLNYIVFLDNQKKFWRWNSNQFQCIADNVREIGGTYYITNDNKLYTLEGSDTWNFVSDNVLSMGGGYPRLYFIGTNEILYEGLDWKGTGIQPILTAVKSVDVGPQIVYITRKDGSVWKYMSYHSDNGEPYLVKEGDKPSEPVEEVFNDVQQDVWFKDSVQYVYSNGIMTGLTGDSFGPGISLARAQFSVILHRMNGEPKIQYTDKFPDVGNGIWYTNAILWANSAGVVGGYSTGLFGPGDNINREQMAVMMYRYAKYMKYDVSKKADFSKYKDAAAVNEFAKEAMQWAVANGIITGKDNETRLDPQGNASRAECATIIMRFMNKNG